MNPREGAAVALAAPVADYARGLQPSDHSFLFFEQPHVREQVFLEWVRAALDRDQAVTHVSEDVKRDLEILARARIRGTKKQIRIIRLDDVYEPNAGGTVTSIGAEFWQAETENAIRNGFGVLRGSVDDTSLISRRGLPELFEAEGSLGRSLRTKSTIALCIYDVTKIRRGSLLSVLKTLSRTHGHAIFEGLATRTC